MCLTRTEGIPVVDMLDEMVLQHQAPLFDIVQQCLFERCHVDFEPAVKDLRVYDLLSFRVNMLVRIDLASQHQEWTGNSSTNEHLVCEQLHGWFISK